MMPLVSLTKCCESCYFAIKAGALKKDLQSKVFIKMEYKNG